MIRVQHITRRKRATLIDISLLSAIQRRNSTGNFIKPYMPSVKSQMSSVLYWNKYITYISSMWLLADAHCSCIAQQGKKSLHFQIQNALGGGTRSARVYSGGQLAPNPQGYPGAMAEFSVKSFNLFVVKGVRSLLKDLPQTGKMSPREDTQHQISRVNELSWLILLDNINW